MSAEWTIERLKAEHPEIVEALKQEYLNEATAKPLATSETLRRIREEARQEAVIAERVRVLGILTHPEAKGRESLATKLASMPSMTVENAASILVTTPKENEVPFWKRH